DVVAAGCPGVAGGGAGPRADGRVAKPDGRRPSRIADRGTVAWGGTGHSSRADGRAGRRSLRGFRLGAGPRRGRRRGVPDRWRGAAEPRRRPVSARPGAWGARGGGERRAGGPGRDGVRTGRGTAGGPGSRRE